MEKKSFNTRKEECVTFLHVKRRETLSSLVYTYLIIIETP